MADYSLLVNVAAVDKASAVFKKLQSNVNTFRSQVEDAGTSGTTSMQQLGTSMQQLGSNMSSTGKLMTATVTAPVLGLGAAVVKTTADFDSAMSQVAAVSGATGKDLEDLRDKAKEMGAKTKFSASEAAEAMNYMAMAGWKTGDMLNGIEGIMNLAAASGEDLATTSDIVTDALTAFGLSAKDSGHFADILAAASSNANTNVSMMGETFKYCAPVAGALGFGAEDTAEAIGLMANSGIKASQAGTSLRMIMNQLTGPIDLTGKELGNVTIQTTKADGSMRDLSDILADCRAAFSKLSEAEQASAASGIFGKNAMSGWLALMNAAPADIEKLSSAISGCDGTAQKMADTMQDNLQGDLTVLKSSLEALSISLGEILIPVAREGVAVIQKMVSAFNALSPGTKEILVKALGLAAAIGPLLFIGGKLISGAGKLVTLGSKMGDILGGLGSKATETSEPVKKSSKAIGNLSANALGFVALGAGILLAGAGLWLIAQAAIAIGEAGAPAAIAMGAMVGVLALLAVGAAALGPALTAGSVGLIAFGAAIAMVGVGVLAASAGLAILAPQLPTIAEYGGSAAVAILELSGALLAFAAGALTASVGSIALGAGLIIAVAGATAAAAAGALLAVGILALSAAVTMAAGAVTLLGGALMLCAAPIVIIGDNASTAAIGLGLMAAGMAALLLPLGSAAALIFGADAALVAFDLEIGIGTLAVLAMSAALAAMDASMSSIADAATTAGNAMADIQGSLDIVKAGVTGLGDLFDGAVNFIISVLTDETETTRNAAISFGTAITDGTKVGLLPITANTQQTLTGLLMLLTTTGATANATTAAFLAGLLVIVQASNNKITASMQQSGARINGILQSNLAMANNGLQSQLNQMLSRVKAAISQIQAEFQNAKLQFNQHIAIPHFSMSGSFNAQTGTTPSVSVSWYRKAYDQAYMFRTPTVVATSGFGDGNGAEVVAGDQHLVDLMREALSDMGGNIVIPVYVGQERIDEMVVTAQQRNNFRSGGR